MMMEEQEDNKGGNEESAQETSYNVSWAFGMFFFFDYFLDMTLVFQHPRPVSSMTGIIHHSNGEQQGSERGYEENAQETILLIYFISCH